MFEGSALDLLILFSCGFGPALLWLWVVRRKDNVEPEPKHLVAMVFVLGCGSAFATLYVRPHLEPYLPWEPVWWRDFTDAFLLTAGVEEVLKFTAFFLGVCWHNQLDEPIDGIIYGAAAGLGFAAVENVFYVLMTGEAALVLARTFTSTLAHVACTGTLGFFAGLTKFRFRPGRHLPQLHRPHLLAIGLTSAVVLHGLYDFFLMGFDRLWWVSLLVALPLMVLSLSWKLRWAQRMSARFHPRLAAEADDA